MKLIVLATAALIATPVLAQSTPSTVEYMVKNGVTIDIGGMEFDVAYKPDGTFEGGGGQFGGKYKIDGNKLCLTIEGAGDAQCTEYPQGKKPGDIFEVPSDFGPMKVTIKK